MFSKRGVCLQHENIELEQGGVLWYATLNKGGALERYFGHGGVLWIDTLDMGGALDRYF